ncbi:unnamed protein product [Cylindrotheca closterium]|uniref:Uncharacterized protein n=1 Tax=Cylindrotheca closterium TaxID=2856 RepID=A0AAD2G6V2_9STRA|nr:unnamed protein product [Cylindrotheca closterium]
MSYGGMPSAEQYQHQGQYYQAEKKINNGTIISTLNRKNILLKSRRRKNGRRQLSSFQRRTVGFRERRSRLKGRVQIRQKRQYKINENLKRI